MNNPKRKSISASLRWQVFARDNFTCRYCGAQAGSDGVLLHVDHIKSVADGGTNAIDNLLTACQRCNGGKGARSLMQLPDANGLADKMANRATSIAAQAEAMQASLAAEKRIEEAARQLKQHAYGKDTVYFSNGELNQIISLCRTYGSDTVLNWYRTAAGRGVRESVAIQYVCGIVRNIKKQSGGRNA